ncbi:hypothetical protein MNBD_PLANCTO03-1939, partial [hydrothermal vent metagenome]
MSSDMNGRKRRLGVVEFVGVLVGVGVF